MRLIDENKVIIYVDRNMSDDGTLNDDISCILEKIQTAYDADKVIEQLEDLKRRYWFTIANTGDEKLDCAYENVGNALDKAIEIVKSGGVAND